MAVNAGWSTCPLCRRRWLVTPVDDCLMPSCGCFGNDCEETNPNRPCEACGTYHYLHCSKRKLVMEGAWRGK